MDTVSEFLESNGGGLGSRNNDDIEKDLQALEYAIRIERNQLGVSNQSAGYKNRSNNEDGGMGDEQLSERYNKRRRN
jgi:hypothetical protein